MKTSLPRPRMVKEKNLLKLQKKLKKSKGTLSLTIAEAFPMTSYLRSLCNDAKSGENVQFIQS
jgi:hypothetical protein